MIGESLQNEVAGFCFFQFLRLAIIECKLLEIIAVLV